MRKARTVAALKPWISANSVGANDTGIGASVDAYYVGETSVTQLGYSMTSFVNSAITTATTNLSTNASIEAFDEPFTMAAILPLVAIFGVV